MSEKSDKILPQLLQCTNNNLLPQTKIEVNDDDEEDDIHIEGNSSELQDCFDVFDSVIEQVPFIDQICLLNDYQNVSAASSSLSSSSIPQVTSTTTTTTQSFSLANYIIHEQIHPHFHLQTHDNIHHLSSTITTISSSSQYFDSVNANNGVGVSKGNTIDVLDEDARYFSFGKKNSISNSDIDIRVLLVAAIIYIL